MTRFCERCGALQLSDDAKTIRPWFVGMLAAHNLARGLGAPDLTNGLPFEAATQIGWLAFEQRRGWREHGFDVAIVGRDLDAEGMG